MATTPTNVACDIANIELADLGKKRIEWANQSMKVLQIIRKEFIKNQPLKGIRISACLHVTAETANLMITPARRRRRRRAVRLQPALDAGRRGGLLVRDYGIPVFAIKGEDNDTYYSHIMAALDHKPHITMDDGADLVSHRADQAHGRARRHHRRHGRDHHRRHPPARHGERRRAEVSRSSPSTTPTPSTCSTIATAPASRRSTASFAPPTSCWPAAKFVVAGYGWCGRGLAIARPRAGRRSHRHRNRSDEGDRSRDGRLPRDADGRSRQDRRRLLHRHRQQERARAANTSN